MKEKYQMFLLFLLFMFIFVVYFSSSAGLYNSLDAPQFFTTEALIRNKNLDLKPFYKDPHFFIYPDYFVRGGEMLSVRGYLLSVIISPIHLFSRLSKNFFSTTNFPKKIVTKNFTYELSVVSFFSLFSAFGLLILWKLLQESSRSYSIATFVMLIYAFGTYIWKYSTLYTRQGFTVFLVSIFTYSLWKILTGKLNSGWIYILLFSWSLSYGIDLILFFAVTVYLILSSIFYILKNRDNYLYLAKSLMRPFFFAISIIVILTFINIRVYDTFLFNQTNKISRDAPYAKKIGLKMYFATPLYPTIFAVLFNTGKLPKASFINYDMFPAKLKSMVSSEFAKRYNFYGIFIVSPFLLLGMAGLISVGMKIKNYSIIILSMLALFSVCLLENTKISGFWGGPQYDIRYFYPYTIFLAIPVSIGLKNIISIKNIFTRIISVYFMAVTSLFSLFMGWFGVLNMYAPALTGERKIWYSRDFMNMTFPNRENFWIPIIFSCAIFLLILCFKRIFKRTIVPIRKIWR